MATFDVLVGTRFKVNPEVFKDSHIERVVLDPKPHSRRDDVLIALLGTEPEQYLFQPTEFPSGYIWNLGKVATLTEQELFTLFERSLQLHKMSKPQIQDAKQAMRRGYSNGSIKIQRLDSVLTREY